MRIIGCDLHARQQTIAILDTETGEVVEKTLEHDGEKVREFYSALPGPVRPAERCSGFCSSWKSSGSTAKWVIQRRSARQRHANRSTTGATRDCC